MTAKVGTINNNELWLRCPECGDSQNDPSKAHFSINLISGLYFCLRCKASGKLGPRQFLSVLSYIGEEELFELPDVQTGQVEELPLVLPGAGSPRYSTLKRGHVDVVVDGGGIKTWDAFQMRDLKDGGLTGLLLRRPGRSVVIGDRGYGWVGDALPQSGPGGPEVC